MKEVWVKIIDYELYYELSNFGQVRSLDRYRNHKHGGKSLYKGRILKPRLKGTKAGNGRDKDNQYYCVQLYDGVTRKFLRIHRLVAQHFIPNPENKPFVNHIDGDTLNNHYTNLEWVTASENAKHAYETGLVGDYRGESSRNHKLTESDVREIRNLRKQLLVSYSELAKQWGMSKSQIRDICNHKWWGHIN